MKSIGPVLVVAAPFAASVLSAGEAAATPSECDAIAGNLVKNCGFETTTDWSFVQQNFNSHTGDIADLIGTFFGTSTQQTITTVSGDTYTLTFWASSLVAYSLDVSFGGTDVLTPFIGDPTYEEFTTTVTASATSSILKFDVTGGYGDLDDVSLVPASTPVPEPAGLALFATGLAGLAGLRRRRR